MPFLRGRKYEEKKNRKERGNSGEGSEKDGSWNGEVQIAAAVKTDFDKESRIGSRLISRILGFLHCSTLGLVGLEVH